MAVRIKAHEARSTESVSAVDHNARNTVSSCVLLLAQRTTVHIDQLFDELVDFSPIEIRRIFCLFEEEGGGVFELLHLIQILIYGFVSPLRN